VGRRLACLAVACLALGLIGGPWIEPVAAGSVDVVSHGDPTEREIALTFDDGVSPANCRRILAILVDEVVPATFFPLAEAMRLDPAFWRLVGQAGYPVGNHTLTHPQMPGLDRAAQVQQIETARVLEESILGRPALDVFRPPYGAYDAATLSAASIAGYPTVLTWSQSDRDTSPTGHEPAMLAAAELGGNGSIVLLHCGPNATPYLLRPLIEFYRAAGYRFVTIPEMLGIPWNPGPTARVSPSKILDGLTPLPPSSSGGPITGPNGWTPPAAASAAPRPSPSRSSQSSRSVPPSPASPRVTQSIPPTAHPPSSGPARQAIAGLVVLVMLGFGSLTGAAALAVRSRRLP
jgi:peptidoglycan-N-acetylglucosamine deacetylase